MLVGVQKGKLLKKTSTLSGIDSVTLHKMLAGVKKGMKLKSVKKPVLGRCPVAHQKVLHGVKTGKSRLKPSSTKSQNFARMDPLALQAMLIGIQKGIELKPRKTVTPVCPVAKQKVLAGVKQGKLKLKSTQTKKVHCASSQMKMLHQVRKGKSLKKTSKKMQLASMNPLVLQATMIGIQKGVELKSISQEAEVSDQTILEAMVVEETALLQDQAQDQGDSSTKSDSKKTDNQESENLVAADPALEKEVEKAMLLGIQQGIALEAQAETDHQKVQGLDVYETALGLLVPDKTGKLDEADSGELTDAQATQNVDTETKIAADALTDVKTTHRRRATVLYRGTRKVSLWQATKEYYNFNYPELGITPNAVRAPLDAEAKAKRSEEIRKRAEERVRAMARGEKYVSSWQRLKSTFDKETLEMLQNTTPMQPAHQTRSFEELYTAEPCPENEEDETISGNSAI